MEFKQEENKKSRFIENINEKITKTKLFLKKHPKQVFTAMIILTVLSLLSNFLYYEYTIKTAKVTYKEMSSQIFDNAGKHNTKTPPNKETVKTMSITEQAGDYFNMKKDLDRLKSYQNKKVLSHEDSLDIRTIVKQYNLD